MDVVPRQSHVTSTQTPPTTLVNTGRLTNSILKTLTWRCAGCGSIFMVFLILSHTTLAFNIHSDKCYSSVSFYECNLWIHIWVDIKWWWSTGSHGHGQSQLLVDITLLQELTELLKTDLAILIIDPCPLTRWSCPPAAAAASPWGCCQPWSSKPEHIN